MIYDTARPFLAAFVILRKKNKIAFVLRTNTSWMDNHYGLPAGKVELNERASDAAIREAREEAGVIIKQENLSLVHICHRKSDDDTLAWIDIIFEAAEWEGEPYNAEPEVHGELIWLDTGDLPDNMVPAVRHYINQLKEGNLYSEFGWE